LRLAFRRSRASLPSVPDRLAPERPLRDLVLPEGCQEDAMSFPQGSPAVKPVRPKAPVFAIGRRMLACTEHRSGRVALTDPAGTTPCATLRNDTEVAIVAWRPGGTGSATLYLVHAMESGEEGWIGAGNLKGKPVPVVPRVVAVAPRPPATPPPAAKRKRPIASKARSR
jgi:hypothetical protein